MTQNLSDLDFHVSSPLKVKCNMMAFPYTCTSGLTRFHHDFKIRATKVTLDGTVGLPTYGFLLLFNSNIWPNAAPLQDISCDDQSLYCIP